MTKLDDMIEEISDRMALKGSPDGTLNKIRINGKNPHTTLKVAIDQIVLLSKSELWSYIVNVLEDAMNKYHKLPAEKQVKVMPDKVKYITALGRELKEMAESRKWHTPRRAMLINDDSETDKNNKTSHTYNLDDIDIENIKETKDITDEDLEPDITEDDIDWDDFDFIIKNEQPKKAEQSIIIKDEPEVRNLDTQDIFNELKHKYKHDKTISQLRWKTKKGTIHDIFWDERKWNLTRSQLRRQSIVNWNSSRHYSTHGKFNFYLIRYKQ